MIDKQIATAQEAVADIPDNATVMVAGFGESGSPVELLHALIDQGAKNLTIISNNAGSGQVGLAALIAQHRVAKIICSFPRSANGTEFTALYQNGEIGLELVPQGTLAERIRAGGAGIPAFYTPTAAGTLLAQGKETRQFEGRYYVMETALRADFALIKSACADRYGNLVYHRTARNFSPIMAMAATTTIVQTSELVEAGAIDPEVVVTPGIYVNRTVVISQPVHESALIRQGSRYP